MDVLSKLEDVEVKLKDVVIRLSQDEETRDHFSISLLSLF
jgi:hypothetical protein